MPGRDLEDKVGLVTGANGGLGLAIAEALVDAGARVLLAARDAERGAEVEESLRAKGADVLFVRVDISRPDQVDAMLRAALDRWGRLDFACNNAGTTVNPGLTPFLEVEEAEWDRVVATNLKGTWLCMKAELRPMLDQGRGSIVNVASIYGLVGTHIGLSPYTATKHGIVGLTKHAALEMGTRGVRVNVVCPAVIRAGMGFRATRGTQEGEERQAGMHPMGRIGVPSEVADAVVWLASERSSFVTGQSVAVDGGWTAR